MNFLAIDTSTAQASIALSVGGDLTTERIATTREQSQQLVPLLDRMLTTAGCALTDLDGIGFGRGPGSFTGVRLASSVVQGLATAAGLGITAVSSMAVAAVGLGRRAGSGRVAVCLDARMGELYYGEFSLENGLATPLINEQLIAPQDLSLPSEPGWAYGGDGFAAHLELRARISSAAFIDPKPNVDAVDMLPFVAAAARSGSLLAAEACSIEYLRKQTAWHKSI